MTVNLDAPTLMPRTDAPQSLHRAERVDANGDATQSLPSASGDAQQSLQRRSTGHKADHDQVALA